MLRLGILISRFALLLLGYLDHNGVRFIIEIHNDFERSVEKSYIMKDATYEFANVLTLNLLYLIFVCLSSRICDGVCLVKFSFFELFEGYV